MFKTSGFKSQQAAVLQEKINHGNVQISLLMIFNETQLTLKKKSVLKSHVNLVKVEFYFLIIWNKTQMALRLNYRRSGAASCRSAVTPSRANLLWLATDSLPFCVFWSGTVWEHLFGADLPSALMFGSRSRRPEEHGKPGDSPPAAGLSLKLCCAQEFKSSQEFVHRDASSGSELSCL